MANRDSDEVRTARRRIWQWMLSGALFLIAILAINTWSLIPNYLWESLLGPLAAGTAFLTVYIALLVRTVILAELLNRRYDWIAAAIAFPYIAPLILSFLSERPNRTSREQSIWEVLALALALFFAQVGVFNLLLGESDNNIATGALISAAILFAIRIAFDLVGGGPLVRVGLVGYALFAGLLGYFFATEGLNEEVALVGGMVFFWLVVAVLAAVITVAEAERRCLTSLNSWGWWSFAAPFATPLVLGLLPSPRIENAPGLDNTGASDHLYKGSGKGPPIGLAPGYMEVSGNERVSALCSDDTCPCGYPGATIPRGEGYVLVSKEVAEFRKDCRTEAEARKKIQGMSSQTGAMIFAGSGVFSPTLMCEQGARKRGLDLEVAAADARHWWDTGQVPLRPTPFATPGNKRWKSAADSVSQTVQDKVAEMNARPAVGQPASESHISGPKKPLSALAKTERVIRDRKARPTQDAADVPQTTATIPSDAGKITYRSQKWGLSLGYPADWEVIWENEPDGGWEIVVGVAGKQTRSGRPFVTVRVLRHGVLNLKADEVVVTAAGGAGIPTELSRSPEQYNESCKRELYELFPGLSLISEATGKVAELPSAMLRYSYRGKTGSIRETQVNLFGTGVTYRLLCEAPEEQAESVERFFDSILADFAPFSRGGDLGAEHN